MTVHIEDNEPPGFDNPNSDTARKMLFPYILQSIGNGFWIVMNREYRPLGVSIDRTGQDIGPDEYDRHAIKLKGLGPKTSTKLNFDGILREDKIVLYNDGCIPGSSKQATEAYLEKLRIILENC